MEDISKTDYIELPYDPDNADNPRVESLGPAILKYMDTVHESENFVAEHISLESMDIRPIGRKHFGDPHYVRLAKFSVEEFNRIKGARLGFVKILRITGMSWMDSFGLDRTCYFTLQCDDGQFYETKVRDLSYGSSVLYIFRPAKNYPWIRESGYSDDRDWDSDELEYDSEEDGGLFLLPSVRNSGSSDSSSKDGSSNGSSKDGSSNGSSKDGSYNGSNKDGSSEIQIKPPISKRLKF